MIHNGRGVWGGDFGSVSFVIVNRADANLRGSFRRLFQKQGEIQSNQELIANFHDTINFPVFRASSIDFDKIPGKPVAYWVSDEMRSIFERNSSLGKVATVCEGMNTANNALFLRNWQEVAFSTCGFGLSRSTGCCSLRQTLVSVPKGRRLRRKWYGNNSYVLDWGDDGAKIRRERNANGKTRAP